MTTTTKVNAKVGAKPPAKKVAKKTTKKVAKKTAKKATKKVAKTTKVTPKKTAKKTTTARKPRVAKTKPVKITDEQRYEMIKEKAYYISEAWNFCEGREAQNWLEAEAFINENY